MRELTEDEVREGYTDNDGFHKGARQILKFDKAELNVQQGTGQTTTFKQLGFNCKKNNHKPEGWYFPDNTHEVAIVLETKSEQEEISNKKWAEELFKNIEIVSTKYKRVVGVLYNGKKQRVFLNKEEIIKIPSELQSKEYYVDLFNNQEIDTQQIYLTTMKINNLLHYKFGVNDYYDRMIFTACALVAKRYGADLMVGMKFSSFQFEIKDTLENALSDTIKQNEKLQILLDMYKRVQMNITDNQEAIDSFIECVDTISDLINSKHWNGEDVMGIFFNEFNRYKGKSESGQVFTPDHITSLMYRLIDVDKDDYVLDAACGSGAFLTKAMANMISEAGGPTTEKAKTIMSEQLFGIEIDRRVYSLACANMLIHKDGKTNLEQLDSTTQKAGEWIKSKPITKVLMNPPYERKCHPEKIIKNVLKNCDKGTKAAFLLPDKKLEKFSKAWIKDILDENSLLKIIKLPEKTFDEGVTVSIFIFETGKPQNNNEIFTCYIKDDGLERVKNQGRQDIKHSWKDTEDKWVEIIKKQSGDDTIKWIDPNICLSYQKDDKPFEIYEEDFIKGMMDYLMFKENIDKKSFLEKLSNAAMYSSDVKIDNKTQIVSIEIAGGDTDEEQN